MTRAADSVRGRIEQLGWTVVHVIDPALVIEGRAVGVSHVVATRGPLRAFLVILLTMADAERAAPYLTLRPSSPSIVSRNLPDTCWEVRARVYDLESARLELEHLRAAFPRLNNDAFERTLTLFERRGWRIDRERSRESFLDEPSWSLLASRAGDVLEGHFGFSGAHGPDRVEVGDFDWVTLKLEHVSASATVSSRRHAEHLVSDLQRLSRVG